MNRNTAKKVLVVQETFDSEGPLTLRRVYYVMAHKQLIKHSRFGYNGLSRLMTKLRKEGIIPKGMIVDRHRIIYRAKTENSFDEAFERLQQEYITNAMDLQEKYVEIWVEKDTMTTVFYDICMENHIPLVISRGFTSYSFKEDAVTRFSKERRPVVVLYFGDFDAEGNYIPEVLKRFFHEALPDKDITLRKVLLNEEDIKTLDLLSIPDSGLSKKKHLQKAYVQEFISKYGKLKYEMEAMPFPEIQKRLIDALSEELDLNLTLENYKMSQREVQEWRKVNLTKAFFDREEKVREVLERFNKRGEDDGEVS